MTLKEKIVQSISTGLPFPKLIVKSGLISGCDIVMKMESKGKFGGVLQIAGT